MNTNVQNIIQKFVSELTQALQEASHEALSIALGGGNGGGAPDRSSRSKAEPGPKFKGSGAAKPAALSALPDGRKRRNADDVQRQLDAVTAFLKRHKEPAGAEAIGAEIGLSTAELAAPIKLGLSSKAIARKGKLRGTRYSLKK